MVGLLPHARVAILTGTVKTSDLFGDRAQEYARHRPSYPDELFDHLERLSSRRELAWDCGAGSGQTTRSLARRFGRVLATDTSLRQLSSAGAHERVQLVAAAAEAVPFRDQCADLVRSASQAWERAHGTDPVDIVRAQLSRAWGSPEMERRVRWPLHGAIGRVR